MDHHSAVKATKRRRLKTPEAAVHSPTSDRISKDALAFPTGDDRGDDGTPALQSQAHAQSSRGPEVIAPSTPNHQDARPPLFNHDKSPTTHMSPDYSEDFEGWGPILEQLSLSSPLHRVTKDEMDRDRNERAKKRRRE
jgi:hypothetical protein